MKSEWNYPTTIWVGENRVRDLGIACKTLNINKPLLVTDTDLAKSNIVTDILKNLKEEIVFSTKLINTLERIFDIQILLRKWGFKVGFMLVLSLTKTAQLEMYV